MKNLFKQKIRLSFVLFFLLTLSVSIAQTDEAVIVDSDFPNRAGLIASLPVAVTMIESDAAANLAETLKQAMAENPSVKNIHLFAPSTETSISMGEMAYTAEVLDQQLTSSDFSTNRDITLYVYSCTLAKNPSGISLLENISSKTGFNVASCASCKELNEEFKFDYSVRPLTITSNLFE
ncbi:DUF4347 domain-containing protein [Muricauda oceani]|jgi:Domain of unknown function (DUF4347)|uniref:DUF4347 domain-containing protein n=2 Tax=Flagellimonas TaxID=444459 RepID=A0A6G7IZA5_9FLAO|nr:MULTISPECIES: DUF4347 domain-containing protein [Allomuricauda]MBW8244917.1 DUF4347 domain-containing protein [Allomuricauda oceani]MDF0708822.1 DUF4347 domain-containing protein [[Muricauda] okinawensis]QII43577.1 DUF4347 domain-containing protein [Allomuricauda oceani]